MTIIAACQIADHRAIAVNSFIVIQQRIRVGQAELHQSLRQAVIAFGRNRISADHAAKFAWRLIFLNGETKTGFKNMIFARNIMAKMAKAFFNTTTIKRMQAAHGNWVVIAAFGNRLENMR